MNSRRIEIRNAPTIRDFNTQIQLPQWNSGRARGGGLRIGTLFDEERSYQNDRLIGFKHPNFGDAINRVVPEGEIDRIWFSPIEEYYFMCPNGHYYNAREYRTFCERGSPRFGDCSHCPTCGARMEPQVYRQPGVYDLVD